MRSLHPAAQAWGTPIAQQPIQEGPPAVVGPPDAKVWASRPLVPAFKITESAVQYGLAFGLVGFILPFVSAKSAAQFGAGIGAALVAPKWLGMTNRQYALEQQRAAQDKARRQRGGGA